MKGLLHLTLCAISATTALGKVTLEHVATESTVSATAYINLPWNYETDVESLNVLAGLPVIPLYQTSDAGYTPCDETTFKPEFMAPKLESWYSDSVNLDFVTATAPAGTNTVDSAVQETPWIALIDYTMFKGMCGITPLHYLYPLYGVLSAQKLGASAVIMIGRSCPQCMKVVLVPDVDLEKRQVRGTEITIPALTIDKKEAVAMLELIEGGTEGLAVVEYAHDVNPLEAVFETFGPYRLMMWGLIILVVYPTILW